MAPPRGRWRRLRNLVVLASLAVFGAGRPALAQQLVADITNHLIAITTGFTGTSSVLFGAVDGGGDIVVVVRGPDREMVVRRKSRVAGIWLNTRSVAFADVPSFYAVYTSRPLDQIVSPALLQLQQLGVENLKLNPVSSQTPPDIAATFRAALIYDMQVSGLFANFLGKVHFLGNRLFRADIRFPATVPLGTYLIQVFQVRDGDVVGGQTVPLVISQTGIEAEINSFADQHAPTYGILAVMVAGMTGWGASFMFRKA